VLKKLGEKYKNPTLMLDLYFPCICYCRFCWWAYRSQ